MFKFYLQSMTLLEVVLLDIEFLMDIVATTLQCSLISKLEGKLENKI